MGLKLDKLKLIMFIKIILYIILPIMILKHFKMR